MTYEALASDYDGTLAVGGHVPDATIDALARLRGAGHQVLLVTGRRLEELHERFPRFDLLDRVVAENGAVLHRPADGSVHALAPAPPDALVAELRARGVDPVVVGRVIVATTRPHEATVRRVIADLGLTHEVIPNLDAAMVLPCGVDKASGLAAALADLGVPPERTVAVGDAENDLAFLRACGLAVAVATALPEVRAAADLVTAGGPGVGVAELVDRLLSSPPGRRTGA